MRTLALFLAAVATVCAAVDGVVLNQTTKQPQPRALVTLYSLGQGGMQPVQTLQTGDDGRFSIDHSVQTPHLLQTIHDGVIYNQMLQPGAPATGLTLPVYDASNKPENTTVAQHMVLIEPMAETWHISESVIFRNAGAVTYNDPANGTLRVWLPPAMEGAPRVRVTAPQGIPLDRAAEAAGEKNVYKIDFPVKPGETRFDISYVVPAPETRTLAGRVLHGGGPVRLVAPAGVTLSGEGITQIGEEPRTHAKVYDVAGDAYAVTIEGAGSLETEAQPAGAPAAGGGSGVQRVRAPIYDRMRVILGLAFAVLLAGFLLLYRRGGERQG